MQRCDERGGGRKTPACQIIHFNWRVGGLLSGLLGLEGRRDL